MFKRIIQCLVVMLTFAGAAQAEAVPGGPTLLFDAQTGEVLSQERAGEPWYPASLTKLMTAYIVFQRIRDGSLKLDQQVMVSSVASGQEPSKIGIPAGKTVSVDFALQALLIYSANDMAYVLAEAAAGSHPHRHLQTAPHPPKTSVTKVTMDTSTLLFAILTICLVGVTFHAWRLAPGQREARCRAARCLQRLCWAWARPSRSIL